MDLVGSSGEVAGAGAGAGADPVGLARRTCKSSPKRRQQR